MSVANNSPRHGISHQYQHEQQHQHQHQHQQHGNPILLINKPVSAVVGASWLYPFKGIFYFLTHPFLYPLLRTRLIPAFLLSIFVLSNLFIWTYLPQVAFLAIFHGPLAWVQGAFLVLGEGAAIVALLFEAFFVDETMVDVFDAVLINEGLENLVAGKRLIKPAGDDGDGNGDEDDDDNDDNNNKKKRKKKKMDPVKRLGKAARPAIYAPFSLRQIVEFVILLPLNFIPLAGTPIFLVLTGYRAGPFHHWRYFKLLGLSKKERKTYVKRKKLKYTWFGTSALLLQLVPVFSMLFLLTTATGSALWVVKLEEARRAQQSAGNHSNIDDDDGGGGDGGGDNNRGLPPPYADEDEDADADADADVV